MKVLCIGQVEDSTHINAEIAKQTRRPEATMFYVDPSPAKGINNRRNRIAENHKKLVEFVEFYKPDLVWQVEGDAVLPENCLEKLLKQYKKLRYDNFGYISGIQVGRHGLYCLGAWVNFTPNSFESLDYRLKGIQKVEATGFYCLLAPTSVWLSGNAAWNGEIFGPDVVWSRSIDKNKYCDMSLTIGHKVHNGIIRPEHESTCNAKFYKQNDTWEYEQL